MALFMLQQMFAVSYRLFRQATDPLYRGLGWGCLWLSVPVSSRISLGIDGLIWKLRHPLWVLVACALRALELPNEVPVEGGEVTVEMPPYLAYR